MAGGRPLPPRKTRPRRWPLRIVGLTGSIAMGKSTVAALLARAGVPVFSADAAVHELLAPGGRAVAAVAAAFPGVAAGPDIAQGVTAQSITAQGIDRQALARAVFGKPDALARLEAILHPLVREDRARFFRAAALQRRRAVAVEIPLLFETPQQETFNTVVVVSAPAFLQRQRALARPGMTPARLDAILARQMKDAKKRKLADIVIPSGLGKHHTLRCLRRSLKML